jgi:adenosylhomocysteine nucleosidase
VTAKLGVITGLKREADCLSAGNNEGGLVGISGANSARAGQLAADFIAGGCTGLLSFGLAGGLAPGLAPGTLILAETVIAPSGERYRCDEPWRERVRAACAADPEIGEPRTGVIAGSDSIAATPDEKHSIAATTDAIAVDVESHAVAAAAKSAGLPFLGLRVIADTSEMTIPRAAISAVGTDGTTHTAQVVAGILARPRELPSLIALANSSQKAFSVLRRVALRCGRDFLLG